MAFPLIPVAIGAAALLLLRGKGSKEPGYSQAPPEGGQPLAEPPPKSRPTSELPEALKEQMITALGLLGVHPFTGELSGAADDAAIRYATGVVGQLDSQGFHDAASDLRKYVQKAAVQVPTPKTAEPIAQALPAGLTQAQRDYVARILALDRDPKVLASLAEWLEALPPSRERDASVQMVEALRLQLLSAQSTNETLQKVDEVVRAPTVEKVQQIAKESLPPMPAPTTPPAMPKLVTSAGQPQPTPAPPPLLPPTPPVLLAARAMVAQLNDAFRRYGSWTTAAKASLNPEITKAFQRLSGGTPDGKPGPATFLRAAAVGASALPIVPYWPSNATAATVTKYKQMLAELAAKKRAEGKTEEAREIDSTAAREQGQSLGLTGQASASTTTPAPSTLKAPPATIRRGVGVKPAAPSGDVILAQSKLAIVDGGRYASLLGTPAVDGRFGSGTEKAVIAFQKAHHLTADGIVGPQTWTALLGPAVV